MYKIDFNHPINVHFMGIGGISMSGLAEILIKEGFKVTGSDMKASNMTDKLSDMGALINIGQTATLQIRSTLSSIQQLSIRTMKNFRLQKLKISQC